MGKSRGKRPATSSPMQALAGAVHATARSAGFIVDGALPAADPGLVVEGIGPVPVPLRRGAATALVAACRVAPYGKGTQTLVDDRVRKTFELDPAMFTLGAGWTAAVADATRTAAAALGLPAGRLEARLYKLLVYEKGGFFLPYRDSEKDNRMVASLVAVLPNPFEGGTLVVRHIPAEQRILFRDAATGTGAGFVEFYADCEHEVERVTSGVRVAVAYNLVLAPGAAVRPADTATPADALVRGGRVVGRAPPDEATRVRAGSPLHAARPLPRFAEGGGPDTRGGRRGRGGPRRVPCTPGAGVAPPDELGIRRGRRLRPRLLRRRR